MNSLKDFLVKIYLILTLDCEQSAKLTSDSFDRDLDWSEYIATRLHRLICSKSRRLNSQLTKLNNALQNDLSNAKDEETKQPLSGLMNLPAEAKERIRTKLRGLEE